MIIRNNGSNPSEPNHASSGPRPQEGPSAAAQRLQGRSGGTNSAASSDDISGLSFDHGGGESHFMKAFSDCYVPENDGHGKFTPCPRTKFPRTDHGAPGDNKKPHGGYPGQGH